MATGLPPPLGPFLRTVWTYRRMCREPCWSNSSPPAPRTTSRHILMLGIPYLPSGTQGTQMPSLVAILTPRAQRLASGTGRLLGFFGRTCTSSRRSRPARARARTTSSNFTTRFSGVLRSTQALSPVARIIGGGDGDPAGLPSFRARRPTPWRISKVQAPRR